jgi:hypothetical protein
MKHSVTTFKNMKICLKELEKFIRNGAHVETGRGFARFGGLRSREIFGNWLLCAALNFEHKSERLKICTDPRGGDGVIYDTTKKIGKSMEHVLVSQSDKTTNNTETLILEQINKKQKKGKAYASGKLLVVFLNKAGENWTPNKIAKKLPIDLYFNEVWVVGLHGFINEEHIYNVTKLVTEGCPIWQIAIKKGFDEWHVKKIQ